MFLDGVGCKGMERKLVDCDRYPRLGFIDERCACNEENCVEDLGVRCPGKSLRKIYQFVYFISGN